MVINPTYLAQRTASSTSWPQARQRVVSSYRKWLRAAPEIQKMYSLNKSIAELRTKLRQEFERHRYVNQIKVVDMLIFQSDAEFQETLNYWKQYNHIMKYFRAEETPAVKIPNNFMTGFLEGRN